MVMGGFSIDEILKAPHKKKEKDQRSNYQRNLYSHATHAPYSAFDLSFSSDSYKVGLLLYLLL